MPKKRFKDIKPNEIYSLKEKIFKESILILDSTFLKQICVVCKGSEA